MAGFNHKKAVQSLNFFALKEGGTINNMKAIKLIWLSDRTHLRKYGRPIIMDQYFALPYGPVPTNTKDLITNQTSFLSEDEIIYRNEFISEKYQYNFSSIKHIDTKVFSKTDLSTMEAVYEEFGNLDQFELSKISHNYPEWKKFESGLKNKLYSRHEMNYLDFFKDPNDPDDKLHNSFFEDTDKYIEIAREIFNENNDLAYGIS